MTAPRKLAAFAAALTLLFGAGALGGAAAGPAPQGDAHAAGEDDARHTATDTGAEEAHGGDRGHSGRAADPVRGLAVAGGGLRLVVDDPELRRNRAETLTLRVLDATGAPARDFDVEHERRLHMIVARRDLAAFQHVHPRQRADGAWETRLRLDDAGSYRLFADFVRGGTSHTLATDLRVDGDADLRPLPAPATAARAGDHVVELDSGPVHSGREAPLRFAVTRDGRTVHTQPYLGAGGHLVALREGDLAFLHVHPTDGGPAAGAHDDAISFAATFPTSGRYRLFLQFRHEDRVRTAAFTVEAR